MQQITPQDFHNTIRPLRRFFLDHDFFEMHTQDRPSILAACEDPETVVTFDFAGQKWPQPQTGQMWLEDELLRNPMCMCKGFFTVSTSYRNEPKPIPGRHDLIFPMLEFECRGNMDDLINLEEELLDHLHFSYDRRHYTYKGGCEYLDVQNITADEELKLPDISFLKMFPLSTSPFWNTKITNNFAHKVDIILYGMETIGSAERSCDSDQMRNSFYTISEGRYAEKLFELFGREDVEAELNKYLSFDFFPRIGGGIGITRLIKALKSAKLV